MRNSNHKIHKMLSTPMGPYQFCRQTNPTFRTPEIRWFPEPLRPCTLGLRHQIKLPGPGGSKIFQNGYQKQHRFCQISSNCCICIKMIHPSKFHMGRSFGTYDIKEVNFRDPFQSWPRVWEFWDLGMNRPNYPNRGTFGIGEVPQE